MARTQTMLRYTFGPDIGGLVNKYFVAPSSSIIAEAKAGCFEACVTSQLGYWLNDKLCGAASSDYVELVARLLEFGASDWASALHNACIHDARNVIIYLITGDNSWLTANNALYWACTYGKFELAQFMLEHGANDVNEGLKNACRHNRRAVAELMIKHGANRWNDGLKAACYGRSFELMVLMIAHGANAQKHIRHCSSRHDDLVYYLQHNPRIKK